MGEPQAAQLVLSPAEVEELVGEMWRHRLSPRSARFCSCGEGWKCARRQLAEARLIEAREYGAVSRGLAPPIRTEPPVAGGGMSDSSE